MKTYLKSLIFSALAFVSLSAATQTYAVVDYMKVPQGGDDFYLEVEKEWRKIHQARVDKGIIVNWQFYQRMFTGASDKYNYMTVAIYDDVKKMGESLPWDWINENYADSELDAMMEKTVKSRKLVQTEIYELMESASGDTPTKYFFFQRWEAKPGKWAEYEKFEKEIAKPYFQQMIDKGAQTSWSIWTKYLGDGEWDGVWVNGFENFGDWEGNGELSRSVMESMLEEGQTMQELRSTPGKLRSSHGSRELWQTVDYVGPEDDGE